MSDYLRIPFQWAIDNLLEINPEPNRTRDIVAQALAFHIKRTKNDWLEQPMYLVLRELLFERLCETEIQAIHERSGEDEYVMGLIMMQLFYVLDHNTLEMQFRYMKLKNEHPTRFAQACQEILSSFSSEADLIAVTNRVNDELEPQATVVLCVDRLRIKRIRSNDRKKVIENLCACHQVVGQRRYELQHSEDDSMDLTPVN